MCTAATSCTSTGAPDGRLATPIAARAAAARSPSHSPSASEAPSATAECPANPGTHAMYTVSVRHRSIRSRPPAARAAADSALDAASHAAARPSPADRSAPTVPTAASSPSRRGVMPAVNTSPPWTTAGV
jgi:hypothetical protein